MLPKIGAALIQFIPPIASSGKHAHVNGNKQNRDKKDFHKFKPEPEEKKPPEENNSNKSQDKNPQPAVPKALAGRQAYATASAATLKLRTPTSESGSVAHAFVTLLSLFQKKRAALSKWLGVRSYQAAAKEQKHAVKGRKGAVVDDQAA